MDAILGVQIGRTTLLLLSLGAIITVSLFPYFSVPAVSYARAAVSESFHPLLFMHHHFASTRCCPITLLLSMYYSPLSCAIILLCNLST